MNLSRRNFLMWTSGAVCCGLVGYPVLRYILPPRRSGTGLVLAAAVDDLKPMSAIKIPFRNTFAIVVNDAGQFRAFDAACTHLGCIVGWTGAEFKCRCHGGVFAKDGANISGPPPRPLAALPVVVRGGKIYVGE